jgi:Eco57I restriction-modification methylase/TaqI-like C-terminal specificity domain
MDKSTAQRTVSQTFKAAFDRERFRNFVNELTNGYDETKKQTMQIPDAFKPHVASCQRIGTYESPEHELADVLIVHLTESYKLERTRTALRDFVAHKLKRGDGEDNAYKEAALVAFVAPDAKSWRFSFVRMEYETKRDPKTGRIKPEERLTPARRFSYLVGAEEECHTAQARFLDLLKDTTTKPSLAKIEEAFSVESVTKEFFNQYAGLFQRTHAALEAIIATDEVVKADFQAKGVSSVDFAKKLLGQIVFLHFIQKKGWLGVPKGGKWGDGPKNFMRQLADRSLADGKCLFNEVLEPLFYDTLATDRGHEAWCKPFACRIPFLNGGLFEPISGYDWQSTSLAFSNDLFTNSDTTKEGDTGTGILDVFDRYNFTVNEAEPLEKEVAIDPEMLGKVFENLIEENRRKGLGAYYTPREIVHYMCQESLINYLDTTLNPESSQVPRSDIETFIREGDQAAHYEIARKGGTVSYARKVSRSIETHARALDDALKSITVCDPAIGSGAFPVGMMTEIVKARTALTPYFNDVGERTPYHFKRHAIQNSIYGVDIDAGAVEIAKLRLWLSLVVDEEDIIQIKPLPNLDYKVVVGNSLIGVDKDELSNWKGIRRLEELKPQYFNETNHAKKLKLRTEINGLIQAITNDNSIFDFEVYFSEIFQKGNGFSVVIANPPYLGEKGHKETFREIAAAPLGQEFYVGKMDLFYFFVHLALNLSRKNGSIAFITTNYYITATGAKKLRDDFKSRSTIKQLINFNEAKIFETALGQHNMISILEKGTDQNDVAKTCITSRKGFLSSEILKSIFDGKDSETTYFEVAQGSLYDASSNYIRPSGASHMESNSLGQILTKMRTKGRPLESILKIRTGIQTGVDKISQKHLEKYVVSAKCGAGVFVLSENEVGQIGIPEEEKSILKPWFKNSDANRWVASGANESYVILADKSKNNLHGKKVIQAHLKRFSEIISDCSSNAPFLHRPRKINFDGPKIVVPQRARINTFAYNSTPWYASVDVYFITDKSNNEANLKANLAILNSKLYYLWFYHEGKRKGESLELYQKPLSETPMPSLNPEEKKSLVGLVDKIIASKHRSPKADILSFEKEIDLIVYRLFGLTASEIALVESSAKS